MKIYKIANLINQPNASGDANPAYQVDGPIPKKLYHATQIKNLKTIEQQGLKTNMSPNFDISYPVVYLATWPDDALRWVGGASDEVTLLEIDMSKLDKSLLYYDRNVTMDDEFEYHADIPISAISKTENIPKNVLIEHGYLE